MSHLYFAYGSNLNRADMGARCSDTRPVCPARLEGWRLSFHGVANITPTEGRTVHGALWRLSDGDLVSLDRYEGAPTLYRRRIVEVRTADGPRRAITYVMERPSYLGLPSPWYYGRIEKGFGDWGLPLTELRRAYLEALAELDRFGVAGFEPDGRKRMKAILPPSGRRAGGR